jgi:hypothetical protein
MDKLQSARWWRFTKYEIRNDTILPVPEAKGEWYNPWEAFYDAREGRHQSPDGKRMMESPYGELFSLEQSNCDPLRYDAASILNWCSRFGLLGLLPHCATVITLPARWAKTDNRAELRMWRKFKRIKDECLVPTVYSTSERPLDGSRTRDPPSG